MQIDVIEKMNIETRRAEQVVDNRNVVDFDALFYIPVYGRNHRMMEKMLEVIQEWNRHFMIRLWTAR